MPSPRLVIRLSLLALAMVVIQETAVSQVSIFGISADLTPLVVMSVGLLAGSLPGAVMGFATGLLVDTVLVQTLGVTSLLYIATATGRAACVRCAIPPTASSRWPRAPRRRPWPASG